MFGKYMPNVGVVELQKEKTEDIFLIFLCHDHKKSSNMSSIFFGYIQPKRRGKTMKDIH